MKLLIINGGYRKRNTWQIVNIAKNRLCSLDKDIVFEEFEIKNMSLPYCTGCSLCFRKGHEYCPHKDMLIPLINKIQSSDGIIFAAPTYNLDMPAMTKNLMDHLSFALHRPIFIGKKALIISTTGGIGVKKSLKRLEGNLKGMGFGKCYHVPIKAYSWNAYNPSEKDTKLTWKITTSFFDDVKSKKFNNPDYTQILAFNLFRGMCGAIKEPIEYPTQDNKFWSDINASKCYYFSGFSISYFKKIFGMSFYKIGKAFAKKNTVTYKK